MAAQRHAVLALVTAVVSTSSARADDVDQLDGAYFIEPGAIAFFWLPLLGTITVDTFVPPRERPWLFDADEGGARSFIHREVPGAALTLGGGLLVAAIALGDDPSRYHHTKGLAQSLATSGLLTVSAKRIFGRHRPDFDPATSGDDGRRSFPSGHSTRALATLTYAALYLRYHGFDQWREPGSWPWWEIAAYSGIGLLAVGLPAERVVNHRHHASDALVGGAIGAASSILFFYFQERRYHRALDESPATERGDGHPATASPESLPAATAPMLLFNGVF